MQEKELRLAIVCSGGISLAVYMHGIAKEILKLARASKLYHSVHDANQKRERRFSELPPAPERETDTEEVYFDLLREIGAGLDLRVIVDVIAGASAGGINSVPRKARSERARSKSRPSCHHGVNSTRSGL